MKTQTIYVDACTSTGIAIGRRNTYATEQIVFGLAALVQQYGAGSAVLMVLRPTDTTPYPAVTSQSGTELTWTVSATDTSVQGTGECELYWYVDGGLAKSVIFPLTIQRDIITEPIDEPPEPYQTWVDDLTELGAETLQNAQAAAQSATAAEVAKTAAQTAQTGAEAAKTAAQGAQTAAETAQGKAEDAQEAAESAKTDAEAAARQAEDALEEFTTPTASANTLEPDEEATASYANGHFTFGIPQGVPGDPGDPGVTPDFSIGTVQTLQPSQPATASITGTAEHPVLNLGIPQGAQGDPATNLVQSVNGKTGAVVLGAGDIGYDGETTYPDATVGKELGTINSALTSLSSVTEIIDTASGAIASFPDGSGLPMRSLVAEINPVQDLHGYDAPWPAGGGKNKLAPWVTTQTNRGVTWTANADGTFTSSGTATDNPSQIVSGNFNLPVGEYIISGCPSGGSSSTYFLRILRYDGNTLLGDASDYGSGKTFTIDGTETHCKVFVSVNTGLTAPSGVWKPMIRLSSVTDATYAPYSNICPITGWTGLSGQRVGKNLTDDSIWDYSGISRKTFGTSAPRIKDFLNSLPAGTYTVSADMRVDAVGDATKRWSFGFWGEGVSINAYLYATNPPVGSVFRPSFTVTMTGSNRITSLYVYASSDTSADLATVYDWQIERNTAASDYSPYTTEAISVSWQDEAGTVYDGSATYNGDGTWTLVAEMLFGERVLSTYTSKYDGDFISYGFSDFFTENVMMSGAICNVAPFSFSSDLRLHFYVGNNAKYLNIFLPRGTDESLVIQGCAKLSTPQTYTITTGELIDTIYGQNNVWVNTGDVTVTYQASIKGYIDKVLAS